MSDASSIRNGALSRALFTPIPEGQLFRCAPPWMFGRVREYRLTNAQADQVMKDFGRAQMRCMLVMVGGMAALAMTAAVVTTLAGVEANLAQAHPVIYGGALLALALVMLVLARAVSARIYGASLKDVPYTLAPPRRQGLGKTLEAIRAAQALLPLWAHMVLLCVVVPSLVHALRHHKPIGIALYGILAVSLVIDLIARLRAPRDA